jgi:hypothetical protein
MVWISEQTQGGCRTEMRPAGTFSAPGPHTVIVEYTESLEKGTMLPARGTLAVAHFLHQAAALLFAEPSQIGPGRVSFRRVVVIRCFTFAQRAIAGEVRQFDGRRL